MKNRGIVLLSLLIAVPLVASCGKTNRNDKASLSFSSESVFLKEGESSTFKLNSDKKLSSIKFEFDKSIISYDGVTLKGIGEGSTKLTAKYNASSCSCFVYVALNDLRLEISNQELNLDPGQEKQLYLLNDNNPYPYAYWVSGDESIATVSEEGLVKGVSAGNTIITAYSHGEEFECEINVFGVDDSIKDWFEGEEPLYGEGWGQNDLYNEERGYKAWGRLTKEGIYMAGYGYHKNLATDLSYWWGNTNFEVKMLVNGSISTYYSSENIICPDAYSYMKTIENANSVSDFDKYYSQFELFIPYENSLPYVRLSFAFKTEGEKMHFVVGGDSPIVTEDDWWWIDLHHPTNTAEYFYLYPDGLHEEEVL